MQKKGCLRGPLVYPQGPADPWGVHEGDMSICTCVHLLAPRIKPHSKKQAWANQVARHLPHARDTSFTPPNYQAYLYILDVAVHCRERQEGGQLLPCGTRSHEAHVHSTPGSHGDPKVYEGGTELEVLSLCLWLYEAVPIVITLVPGTHEIRWG